MAVSMDVVQQHSFIRFMVLQKKKPKEIYEELVATLGDNAFSHATMKKRVALF